MWVSGKMTLYMDLANSFLIKRVNLTIMKVIMRITKDQAKEFWSGKMAKFRKENGRMGSLKLIDAL